MRREQRMDSCSKEPLLLINAAMLQMSHSTDHLHANVSTTLPVHSLTECVESITSVSAYPRTIKLYSTHMIIVRNVYGAAAWHKSAL